MSKCNPLCKDDERCEENRIDGGGRVWNCRKNNGLPALAPCSTNASCYNSKCGRYGESGDLACCPGDMQTSWNYDYCIAEPNEKCFYNKQCRSDNCNTITNTCASQRIGEACAVDTDCENGLCGRQGRDQHLACCAKRTTALVNGVFVRDFCVGEKGASCHNDYQCELPDKCDKDGFCN